MNLYILKIIIFFITIFGDLNYVLNILSSSIIIKIILDERTIKTQINNYIKEIKLNNLINKNKYLKKIKIRLYIYKNYIILIGKVNNIKKIIYIENLIKKYDKNFILLNNIICKKSMNENISDIFLKIKIYYNLFYYKNIYFLKYKIFTENNNIFILKINNDKSKNINIFFNKLKKYKNYKKILNVN